MDPISPSDRERLAQLIRTSLGLADDLGATCVGIALDAALVQLTGEGVPPR